MYLDDLLITRKSRLQLLRFVSNPSHALILEGPKDAGKIEIISALAKDISRDSFAELHQIGIEEGSIKIDEIKQLKTLLKLQVPENTVRIVLIPDADRMTPETQNSLLKVLEEPPESTYFLMSTSNKRRLLPTVDSRATKIALTLPSEQEFIDFQTRNGCTDVMAKKLFAITGGAIKKNELDGADNKIVVDLSKKLLTTSAIERLGQLDKILKDESMVNDLLNTLEHILTLGYTSALNKGQNIHQWINKLSAVEQAQTELQYGVNKRVVFTKLLMSL